MLRPVSQLVNINVDNKVLSFWASLFLHDKSIMLLSDKQQCLLLYRYGISFVEMFTLLIAVSGFSTNVFGYW